MVSGGYVASTRAISLRLSSRRRSASAASNTTSPSSRFAEAQPQVLARRRRPPRVALVHAHERRDVHALVDLAARLVAGIEDVGVPLAPGRVRHLRDHGVQRPGRVEAEQEADGVEADAEVARAGRAAGPGRSGGARAAPHQPARRRRRAARPGRRGSRRRRSHAGAGRRADQSGNAVEHLGQLGEVEQGQEEPVAELVLHRAVAAVRHPPLVEGGGGAHAASGAARARARGPAPRAAPTRRRPRGSPSASTRRSSGCGANR